MARYCVGLPLTGIRPLTLEEMEIVRSEAGRFRFASRAIWLLMPIAMVTWLGLLASGDDSMSAAIVLGMFGGLALLGVAIAFARERGRRGKQLRRDLVQGSVLVFDGVPRFEFGDKAQTALIGRGYFQVGTIYADGPEVPSKADGGRRHEERAFTDRHVVEVLESSNRIFQVDGRRLPDWLPANVIEMAMPEPWTSDFPRHFEPIEMRMREEVRRRALSESEKQELNRLWGRTVLGIALLAGLTLYVATIGFGFMISPKSHGPDPAFRIFGYAIGIFDILMLRILPGILRCRTDARNGVVLILDLSERRVFGGEESEVSRRVVEALPLSGRVWTVDGYPAQWRRAAARQSGG